MGVGLLVMLAGRGWAQCDALAWFDEAAAALRLGIHTDAREAALAAARAELAASCAVVGCDLGRAAAAIRAVLAERPDGHTRLLGRAEAEAWTSHVEGAGRAPSVGAWFAAPAEGLGLVVIDVMPGSPADAVGIGRGDRVLAADGSHLPANPGDREAAWAAALADGAVEALVLAAGGGPRVVRLVARPLPVDRRPALAWPAPRVAWLRLPSLLPAEAVAREVHDLVAIAVRHGAVGLILDLRDDAGGSVIAAVAVQAAFDAAIERRVQGEGVDLVLRCGNGVLLVLAPDGSASAGARLPQLGWSGPLVVIVNRRTASCAEGLASELRRRVGAIVVGETTAGSGDGFASFLPLSHGMALVLLVARAADETGAPLPARVVPDVAVPDDVLELARGRDRPLAAAVELLRSTPVR